MNKSELIDALADRMDSDRKTATKALGDVIDIILRSVAKGEKVGITGFGVFEKRDRSARTARNPRTGASIKVKKTSVPAFRPGQNFKLVVSGKKKLDKLPTAAAKKTAAKKTTSDSAAPTRTAAKTTAAQSNGVKTAPPKIAAAKAAPAKTAATKTTPAAAKAARGLAKATKAPAKSAKTAAAKKTTATKAAR